MNNLLIIGAGGHANVVGETAKLTGIFEEISLIEINNLNNKDKHLYSNFKVIGNFDQINQRNIKDKFSHVIVGIGDCQKRKEIMDLLSKMSFNITSIIHPNAYISTSASIGNGSVIMANSVIQTNSKIGNGCIVNTSSNIDHDCIIEDFVHISPGANIAGNAYVGECTWVGIGASIIQGLTIGENVIIGAGSAVIKSIPNNVVAVGIPAKIKKLKN